MTVLEDKLDIKEEDFLWKYLDFYKFMYLLLENKIYFTRLDLFDDPHEGLTDRAIFDKFFFDQSYSIDKLNTAIPFKQRQLTVSRAQKGLKDFKEVAFINQVSQYASCWYTSHRESRAMWDLYSNCDSVALRFSGHDLIQIIKNEADKNSDVNYNYMIIGSVYYRDLYPPDTTINPERPNTYSINKKDSCYAHEREFRFVVNRKKPDIKTLGFELNFPLLSTLNFNIITHPKMADWKFILLGKLLEQFDLRRHLSKSLIQIGHHL